MKLSQVKILQYKCILAVQGLNLLLELHLVFRVRNQVQELQKMRQSQIIFICRQ